MARLFQSLLILITMSAVVYGLMGLMPGDPVLLMITSNPHITPEDVARLKSVYGLDQPLLKRYLHWAGDVLHGDFGYSRLFSQPVVDVLALRLPQTLLLMATSLFFALLVSIPLGVIAAFRPEGRVDRAINLFCFAGVSMPTFWLAILLILLFSVKLGWLPAGGNGAEEGGFFVRLKYLVMPALVLTLVSAGTYTRYVRAKLVEVAQQDFMRTARAKGLSAFAALWRHGLRHALIPLVTLVGIEFGSLFSGALITETMFSWPGMGRLIYEAIMGNDYNLALAALLLATFMTLAGNLAADLIYYRVDPRLSRQGA